MSHVNVGEAAARVRAALALYHQSDGDIDGLCIARRVALQVRGAAHVANTDDLVERVLVDSLQEHAPTAALQQQVGDGALEAAACVALMELFPDAHPTFVRSRVARVAADKRVVHADPYPDADLVTAAANTMAAGRYPKRTSASAPELHANSDSTGQPPARCRQWLVRWLANAQCRVSVEHVAGLLQARHWDVHAAYQHAAQLSTASPMPQARTVRFTVPSPAELHEDGLLLETALSAGRAEAHLLFAAGFRTCPLLSAAHDCLVCGCTLGSSDDDPDEPHACCEGGASSPHCVCAPCFRRHVETQVTEYRRAPRGCVDVECKGAGGTYRQQCFARLLSPRLWQLYNDTEAHSALAAAGLFKDIVDAPMDTLTASPSAPASASMERMHTCPWCARLSLVSRELTGWGSYRCTNCAMLSCSKCDQRWHSGECSAAAAAGAGDDSDHVLSNVLTDALVRRCPNCLVRFVKEDGCNKMQCSACGTATCYLCRAQIPHDYTHFCACRPEARATCTKCHIWDDPGRRDATVEAAVRATFM